MYSTSKRLFYLGFDILPKRNSRPAILLHESWHENDKAMKCILANISDWPPEKATALRRVWKNELLHSSDEVFSIERSLPHGHVEAILEMIRHIGLDEIIASRRTRERDLVLAMIVERLIVPFSKLATTRLWHGTPLRLLNVDDADEDELSHGAGHPQLETVQTEISSGKPCDFPGYRTNSTSNQCNGIDSFVPSRRKFIFRLFVFSVMSYCFLT